MWIIEVCGTNVVGGALSVVIVRRIVRTGHRAGQR